MSSHCSVWTMRRCTGFRSTKKYLEDLNVVSTRSYIRNRKVLWVSYIISGKSWELWTCTGRTGRLYTTGLNGYSAWGRNKPSGSIHASGSKAARPWFLPLAPWLPFSRCPVAIFPADPTPSTSLTSSHHVSSRIPSPPPGPISPNSRPGKQAIGKHKRPVGEVKKLEEHRCAIRIGNWRSILL